MESTQPILRCRYSYDPLDRLISQLQPDAPAHQRFYCKSRLATEIQGAMRFSIVQQGDQLLAQQSGGDAPDTTLLATDQQRSVLQTLKANHPPQFIAYSPYGHRPVESGLLSLLGFNGERPDPVTGFYLLGNGYRAFNPVLMRFNSTDSLSPFGVGGLNAYTYCAGEPVLGSDPTGHKMVFWKSPSRVLSGSTSPGVVTRTARPALDIAPPNIARQANLIPPHTRSNLGLSEARLNRLTLDQRVTQSQIASTVAPRLRVNMARSVRIETLPAARNTNADLPPSYASIVDPPPYRDSMMDRVNERSPVASSHEQAAPRTGDMQEVAIGPVTFRERMSFFENPMRRTRSGSDPTHSNA